MKKIAILVGLMALAVVIGVTGTTFRADKAAAKPTDVIAFNPDVCAGITHSAACYDLQNPANLAIVAEILDGAVDDPSTYDDLVNASDAQLGDDSQSLADLLVNSQSMWVLTFVSNDANVQEVADEGVWLSTGTSDTALACPFADEDCNADGTKGDGVVVDLLYSGVPLADTDTSDFLDRGDATIDITQAGVDQTLDYTVVGGVDDITLKSLKTTIQENSGAPCVLGGYPTNEFTQENALADVTGLLATIVDDDGTELTGIWVAWAQTDSNDDPSDITLAKDAQSTSGHPLSVSVFKSKQASAPNVACGGDPQTGAKIDAAYDADADGVIENERGSIDDEVTLDVVTAPASMTLAANPATIMCDGTTNSTVSATVLGDDSKPVVSGNAVRFDVVALGTANPIVGKTDDKGVASSVITPLSGPLAGVTVLATVDETSCNVDVGSECSFDTGQASGLTASAVDLSIRDNECYNPCNRESSGATDVEGSILVNCQQAAPTVAPPVVIPTALPPIRGPNTGDGGYLP
ncbi:MAG: hypothetical protein ABR978_01610 [Dehalococcoidia bacterium]